MSEDLDEAFPADLIPLWTVHNDERREHLISIINTAHKKRTVALWAYKGHHGIKLQRVPETYELNWLGGPGREDGDHPDFPEFAYYCDVTAEPRLRHDKPGAYVLHAGATAAEVFTQVLISKAVLTRLRSGETGAPARGHQEERRASRRDIPKPHLLNYLNQLKEKALHPLPINWSSQSPTNFHNTVSHALL